MFRRASLGRTAVAAGVATLADFALVVMLVERMEAYPSLATVLGCVAGALVNFTINRVWVFQSLGSYPWQMARYATVSALSAVFNALLVHLGLWLSAGLAGVPYQVIWWLARGGVFVAWNFPLNRDYVFATPPTVISTPLMPRTGATPDEQLADS